MVKEYRVDNRKMKKIINNRIKNHPKWKKRKWVRYTLIFVLIISLIAIPSFPWTATEFIFDGKHIEEIGADTLLSSLYLSFVFITVCIGMPIFLYIRSLKNECRGYIGYLNDQIITLEDESMYYSYSGNNTSSTKYYIEKIDYKFIRKIVLNRYNERLDIYCDMGLVVYSDYENEIVDYTKKYENYTKKIILYYENSEDLVQTLSEKTGVSVQAINEADENYN